MYDPKKAEARGLIVPCVPDFYAPIRFVGVYRCEKGHAHKAFKHHGHIYVQDHGFDWAFLDAIDSAYYRASVGYDPLREPADFLRVYRATLIEKGYGDVLPDEGGPDV